MKFLSDLPPGVTLNDIDPPSNRPGPRLKRLKVLTSYAAHARHCAEESSRQVGYIPHQSDIPSPYAYSPSRPVYKWRGKYTVTYETRHRRFEVFEVPENMVLKTDKEATDIYLASRRH